MLTTIPSSALSWAAVANFHGYFQHWPMFSQLPWQLLSIPMYTTRHHSSIWTFNLFKNMFRCSHSLQNDVNMDNNTDWTRQESQVPRKFWICQPAALYWSSALCYELSFLSMSMDVRNFLPNNQPYLRNHPCRFLFDENRRFLASVSWTSSLRTKDCSLGIKDCKPHIERLHASIRKTVLPRIERLHASVLTTPCRDIEDSMPGLYRRLCLICIYRPRRCWKFSRREFFQTKKMAGTC